MKNVLVTGGYGFIGGHLLRRLIETPEVEKVCVIDNFSEGSNLDNHTLHTNSVKFTYHADYDTILHLAAASHVDSVNSHGALALANVKIAKHAINLTKSSNARLIVLSTDEVYGETWPHTPARPSFPLNPSSPYSGSKAACDMLAIGFAKTYGMDVRIVRAGNNYGTGQHKSKLIPKLIDRIKRGESFPLYGNGRYWRSWQHVDFTVECLMHEALDTGRRTHAKIAHSTSGAQYLSNIEIAERLAKSAGLKYHFVDDRPAHDQSYYCETSYPAIESSIVQTRPNVVDFILSQL